MLHHSFLFPCTLLASYLLVTSLIEARYYDETEQFDRPSFDYSNPIARRSSADIRKFFCTRANSTRSYVLISSSCPIHKRNW